MYANVDKTFIDGELFFDRQKDIADRDARARERQQLERAEQQTPARQQRPAQPFIPNEEQR